MVRTSTRAGDCAAASAEIAATPSIVGIRRSIRITSGASAPARRTASAPSPASPTTSNSSSPSNIPISPLRTTGWSSTIITRIGDAHAVTAGTEALIAVPPSGSDSISSVPSTPSTRWRIAVRPKPPPSSRGARGREPLTVSKADAVVADVERHLILHVGQRQPDAAGAGVLGHVRERLLSGAQQRDLQLRPDRPRAAGRRHRDRHAVQPGPAARDLLHRLGQPGVGERLGSERLDRSACLGQARSRELDCGLQMLGPRPRPRRGPPGALGRLQLGDDPGQALGDRVVDLPRHPAALLLDSRLARLASPAAAAARRSRASSAPARRAPGSARRARARGGRAAPRRPTRTRSASPRRRG